MISCGAAKEILICPIAKLDLCSMAITFESEDEMLEGDHLNQSIFAVLSCGTVNYDVRCGSNFRVCG